jgi:hemoglobin
MREAHRGMGITDEEFDVVAEHLDRALAENGASGADRERVLAEVEELRPEIVEDERE